MQSWLYLVQRNPACSSTELQTEKVDPAAWVGAAATVAAGNSNTPRRSLTLAQHKERICGGRVTCQILWQPDLLSPDCKSGPNSLFSGVGRATQG